MPKVEPLAAPNEALDRLLASYGRFLRNAIVRACPKDVGLQFDDIEQEARLRLWRALQNETEIENPASYLYRIAVTTTIDAVRRVAARREEQLEKLLNEGNPPSVEPFLTTDSPETIAERRLLLRRIEAALGLLSAERRRAVGLHLRGFTPPEIGKLLRWSESKARSLVYRGLQELRQRLAAEGIEYEAG